MITDSERVMLVRRRRSPLMMVSAVVAVSLLIVVGTKPQARGSSLNNKGEAAAYYGASLSAEECGGGALWAYSIPDAQGSEVLAAPGCPVRLRVAGDAVARWGLSRVWSGAASIPGPGDRKPQSSVYREGGSLATATLWEPGLYRIEATTARTGLVLSTLLRCLYVRKEVRKMTGAERAAYLEALEVVATTSTARGKELYGPGYQSVGDLVARHLRGSGNIVSDELHEGLGFLSQHAALSNEFEKSLQSVDPSVALPYWDFTRDRVGNETSSIVNLNPELWGSGKNENENDRGLFEKLPTVPRQGDADFDPKWVVETNAYGYLRAPWNLNPEPRVRRFWGKCGIETAAGWPRCESHRALLDKNNLGAFLTMVQGSPHGAVHMTVGGLGLECDPIVGKASALFFKHHIQLMFRLGVLRMPTRCGDDAPCHYECVRGPNDDAWWHAHYFASGTALQVTPVLEALTQSQRRVALEALCSRESAWVWGEQAGADSPWDPSFWPMHPTLERLYQFKRLIDPDFQMLPWGIVNRTDQPWKDCKWEPLSSCKGHHAHDLTAYVTTYLDEGAYKVRALTNQEMLDVADPRAYKLDYIYDSFEWDHCDDFRDLAIPFEEEEEEKEGGWTPTSSWNTPIKAQQSPFCDAHGVYAAEGYCDSRALPVVEGADVVAYRDDDGVDEKAILGSPEFAVTVEGSFIFWFSSSANRDAFVAFPHRYAPELGGFCALGLSGADPMISDDKLTISDLHKVPVDPASWWLDERNGGGLYFFQGPEAKAVFLDAINNGTDLVASATANWHRLIRADLPCVSDALFNTKCFSSYNLWAPPADGVASTA
ncbi:hypothetical protein CTAYLR_005639 [Chrysophaeum taylorii]|uniref:Tyrosinase copper-binding domain-containing protein n=1 Tax=Chrysophaeum taylorii TaxID=2483200 RepID=A0AAD7UPE3_9STRA|nr:hypothetical protein CTAYLR_005639 [Chrysophaeum taylorii]